jgi:hypothetical protein
MAALALLALAAPAAQARRTKEQHLLDNARTSARAAGKALSEFQAAVGGGTTAAGADKQALAARLDALDYQLNVARKNAERLSRRLAARRVVIAARAKRRSTPKGRAADRALAKRIGRASTAAGQAGAALVRASTATEQLAFDLRSTPPPDPTPVSVPVGEVGKNVDEALALLQKVIAPVLGP